MADIAVIIVNYNAGPLLIDAVASLAGQVVEIVVIDNASCDGSPDQLERCAREQGWPLRLVRNPDNRGFAVACNQGVHASSAPLLLFLNPDCRVPPGSLDRLRKTLITTPNTGIVGGLLLNPDGTEQRGGRRLMPTPALTLARATGLTALNRLRPGLLPDFNLAGTPLPPDATDMEALSGACMLVRRDALEAVGGWDEGYFLHCEDLDLCVRMRESGQRVLFDPAAPVYHRQGSCSASRPVFVEWHKHRGMLRFFATHFNGSPLMLRVLVQCAIVGRFVVLAMLLSVRRSLRARPS